MIRNTFHKLLRLALSSRFGFWLARRIVITLRWHIDGLMEETVSKLSPDARVQGGPFQGLRYPQLRAAGSALAPKLIGSYEAEIQASLEACLGRQPDLVVNIGCGEGYYAVGCALRLPSAQVVAYDMDPEAMAKCQKMARHNGVADRVVVSGECTPAVLRQLSPVRRLLVLCDCEGAELQLLYPENFPATECDLLVELHRVPGHDSAREISARFEKTHQASIIRQTPRLAADYPALRERTSLEQHLALDEQRPYQMSWLYLCSQRTQTVSR